MAEIWETMYQHQPHQNLTKYNLFRPLKDLIWYIKSRKPQKITNGHWWTMWSTDFVFSNGKAAALWRVCDLEVSAPPQSPSTRDVLCAPAMLWHQSMLTCQLITLDKPGCPIIVQSAVTHWRCCYILRGDGIPLCSLSYSIHVTVKPTIFADFVRFKSIFYFDKNKLLVIYYGTKKFKIIKFHSIAYE